ncbi:MAG: cysteine--tRNA ligase [Candidatus Omnitrophica bacterium CG1_02_46_14]|nr:MAG: cysteine--tRNA ligase [Candidatus Omnitrophica bacterium CG1_02_46_14]
MPLKIYNSLAQKKEEFKPIKAGEVKMYVCGPTVYDEPHIGHLRSAYEFDVMRRYLEYSGYKVTFVRNVTDVDDKIIEKARQNNAEDLMTEVRNVSEKYLLAYKKDLEKLGIQEPTREPKATEHIKDMIALIERLIKRGIAYESQGDVYYNVNTFKSYGKLSHQRIDEILEHVRIDANEKKKNPLDFALWKKSKEGEPFWNSPWGKGRPGWHIECSAMSMKYLGETFDIHGGGRDLIFPHHENEIAQSEGATGSPFVHIWLHHGLITINEQKMSKSLHNFVTLKDIQKKYGLSGIEELKFLFLGTHYSAPLDYSEEKMIMERSIRSNFLSFFMEAESFASDTLKDEWIKDAEQKLDKFEQDFLDAMNDDFNTPLALTGLQQMIHYARKADSISVLRLAKVKLEKFLSALGLTFRDAYLTEEFKRQSSEKNSKLNYLLNERKMARQSGDYKKADEVRKEILELYKDYEIEIIDRKDGSAEFRAKLR